MMPLMNGIRAWWLQEQRKTNMFSLLLDWGVIDLKEKPGHQGINFHSIMTNRFFLKIMIFLDNRGGAEALQIPIQQHLLCGLKLQSASFQAERFALGFPHMWWTPNGFSFLNFYFSSFKKDLYSMDFDYSTRNVVFLVLIRVRNFLRLEIHCWFLIR